MPTEATAVTKGTWYPDMPPRLTGESDLNYANRITGQLGPEAYPYDHTRFRHCAVGWHDDCSDPDGKGCKCPCHRP